MNGAVSNLAVTASSMGALGHELRSGGYDVVHVHEPNVPGGELVRGRGEPGARRRHVPHLLHEPRGQRHRRERGRRAPALREAERPDRRLRGRGLDRPPLLRRPLPGSSPTAWTSPPPGPSRSPSDDLEILFIGRAEGRKGLPVLLRAFEALRGAGVGARLTIAGVPAEEVEPLLLDPEGVRMVGRVTEEEKWRLLGSVDVLCAPSLGGESFGMVLTEAFASGTPVVASDIAGYRDVVRDGVDGILVPAGDPVELGEALRCAGFRPGSPRADGRGRARARRALRLAARGG